MNNFNKKWLWFGSGLFCLIVLLVIAFPKNLFEETKEGYVVCDCFGSSFSFGSKCIGFPVSCSEFVDNSFEEKKVCEIPFCSEVISNFEKNSTRNEKNNVLMGSDVLLMIDISKSMEGDKIAAAIEAAKSVVYNKRPKDNIGVVAFSENAFLIVNLTDDVPKLISSIDNISVDGGTNYLPALNMAFDIFSSNTDNRNRGLIFLSDGVPSDNPDEIISKTNLIKSKDVSIFTINFGIDKNDSSILESIASVHNDDSILYSSFSSSDEITGAFYEAYQKITNMDVISINTVSNYDKLFVDDVSSFGVSLNLFGKKIAAFSDNSSLCIPNSSVSALFKPSSEDNNYSAVNYSLVVSKDEFVLPSDVKISPGEYDVSVSVNNHLNGDGICFFSGKSNIGSLNVSSSPRWCNSSTCDDIKLLFDDPDIASSNSYFGFNDDPSRVAFVVDSSKSVSKYFSQVEFVVRRLSLLFGNNNQLSLISFSDESSLLVPFTFSSQKIIDKLDDINLDGTTKIIPAFKKVKLLFSDNIRLENDDDFNVDFAIFFSDGGLHDKGGSKKILSEAKNLVDSGVCVFIVGFGSELLENDLSSNLFKDIVSYSNSNLGCGDFIYDPDKFELIDLAIDLIGGSLQSEGLVKVFSDSPKKVSFGEDVEVSFSVVSSKTGLLLPVNNEFACFDSHNISVSLFKNDVKVKDLEVFSDFDSNYFSLPLLSPGEYKLVYSVSINECDDTSVFSDEFTVFKSNNEKFELFLFFICVFVIVGFVFCFGKWFGSEEKNNFE